jgi:hypothetical protein
VEFQTHLHPRYYPHPNSKQALAQRAQQLSLQKSKTMYYVYSYYFNLYLPKTFSKDKNKLNFPIFEGEKK